MRLPVFSQSIMTKPLKDYCRSLIEFTEDELRLVDQFFVSRHVKRNAYILEQGTTCDFLAFVVSGTVRHFHIKEGDEKTCDISLEGQFITDFKSFLDHTPATICLQALKDSDILTITKSDLDKLYEICPKYETFGRIMAEKVALRATDIAMYLSSEKPAERYKNLMKEQPELFQRVQQKYIANLLGISPESLSRIRKRTIQE